MWGDTSHVSPTKLRPWLHPWESDPEVDVDHDLDDGITHPTLLGPVLVWSQQNYLSLLKTVG